MNKSNLDHSQRPINDLQIRRHFNSVLSSSLDVDSFFKPGKNSIFPSKQVLKVFGVGMHLKLRLQLPRKNSGCYLKESMGFQINITSVQKSKTFQIEKRL